MHLKCFTLGQKTLPQTRQHSFSISVHCIPKYKPAQCRARQIAAKSASTADDAVFISSSRTSLDQVEQTFKEIFWISKALHPVIAIPPMILECCSDIGVL